MVGPSKDLSGEERGGDTGTNTSHLSIRDWKTEQLFCFEDCKLTVPELRDEIQGLKDEKYYLQASYGSNETVSKL